jgi:hypothetical protein
VLRGVEVGKGNPNEISPILQEVAVRA